MARRKRRAAAALAGMTLMMNVPVVMGLRLAKIGRGGQRGQTESQRMVTEKIAAAVEAQGVLVRAMLDGKPERGADQVVRLYARKVAANRRRLSK
ncbi:hypothetical protein [Acidisoma sp. 7E03]